MTDSDWDADDTDDGDVVVKAEYILLARAGNGELSLYLDGKGIDEHLGRISKSEKFVYMTDHLGSVVNSSLAGSKRFYGPFGTSTEGSETRARYQREEPVMYGFTGRQFDPNSPKPDPSPEPDTKSSYSDPTDPNLTGDYYA